ncbi:MAG: type ISP restriction/modification enzyme [Acidimicrobiales bacterium]|jgi:hypothetical protein
MPDTRRYVERLQVQLDGGDSTEHSHRPALADYLESFDSRIVATNEPRRVEAGAPDYSVGRRRGHGLLLVGKIEAKDVGIDLDGIHADSERRTPRTREGEQLHRYREAFDNLIFTDYIQFRWYRRGERRLDATLGSFEHGKIRETQKGIASVEALITDFLNTAPIRIRTARTLAERMARLTDLMHVIVLASIANGTVSSTTKSLQQAFKDVLVSDLTNETFADMFCQTIAYGLFAARVRHDPASGPFEGLGAAAEIPRTNPFLRQVFSLITGPDLEDEPYSGLVDDLAQLLDDTDMVSVLRDFGTQVRRDPIVHFYETFLGEYNPRLRDIRGVYYTPMPVVSYITRSIDQLLIDRFDVAEGLADTSTVDGGEHRVLVLDPATGTGTFLYEVINIVRQRIGDAGMAGAWAPYVREHLLPRMFGFEIMMAPYAVAHLKLGLQLAGQDLPETEREAWAYNFEHDDRVGVFLTNALDPGETRSDILFGQFISDEANAAGHVKTDLPIMVVLGNPPYQGQSMNASERLTAVDGRKTKVRTFIGQLLLDYYTVNGEPLGERNPKWLQDDYVKFIRFGQWRINQTGRGILGFVTNHTYLDAPTFRGMREKLLRSFDDIYVIDLHGSIRRHEQPPEGGIDENVFDQIQQGVSVAIFVKTSAAEGLGTVHFHERWGTRDDKYEWLSDNNVVTTPWTSFTPTTPFYGFRPEDADIRAEWDQGIPLPDIFPVYTTGIVTSRDSLVIDSRRQRLTNRIREFLDPATTDESIRAKFFPGEPRTRRDGTVILPGDTESWSLPRRRATLQADTDLDGSYRCIEYRPFDERFILYHPDAIERDRRDVMTHMLEGPNVGLVSARSNKSPIQDQFFVSRLITEAKTGESTTQSALFPVWCYPDVGSRDRVQALLGTSEVAAGRTPNIGGSFEAALSEALSLVLVGTPQGDLVTTVGPEDILAYVYAVTNSRTYRIRYAGFLHMQYARIPVTRDSETFRALCRLGTRLVSLSLLEVPDLDNGTPSFPVPGSGEVAPGYPKWVGSGETPPDRSAPEDTDRLYINGDGSIHGGSGQFFEGVSQEVWEFSVGGHAVLEKWLRARRGDRLDFEEIRHVSRVANAARLILDTQAEIEELLPVWPLP